MQVAISLCDGLKPETAKAALALLRTHLTKAGLNVQDPKTGGGVGEEDDTFLIIQAPLELLAAEAEHATLPKRRLDGKIEDFEFARRAEYAQWGGGANGFFLPCETGELLVALVHNVKADDVKCTRNCGRCSCDSNK